MAPVASQSLPESGRDFSGHRLHGGVAHLSLGCGAVGWGGAYNIRIHSLNSFVELVHLLAALVFATPFDATVATLQSFENT